MVVAETALSYNRLQAAAAVRKPTMLELSAGGSKRKLSERIQQRLLHSQPAGTAQDDTVSISRTVTVRNITWLP